MSNGTWRKSSYSTGGNNNCVEVASDVNWRKASYSTGGSSNCVEVASVGAVLVRDTTDREGVTLTVSGTAWTRFVAGLR